MKAGSGLACGPQPLAELAREAVQQALQRAGCLQAEQLILLFSREFSRQPQPGILAAARAANCLQICGGTASGLLTEDGWQLDQPAVAVLALGDLPLAPDSSNTALQLAFCGQGRLAHDWQQGPPLAGLLDSDGQSWQQGRLNESRRSTCRLPALQPTLLLSVGLRTLGEPLIVTEVVGHELRGLDRLSASDSLHRHLPAERRARPPLHQICLQRSNAAPAIGILAVNGDGSLTLSEALQPGEMVCWALRQPLAAEQEIRQHFAAARASGRRPDFALMFSCIGRGPLFYGDEDRDLLAFRENFPDTPLLGAYGTGQIFPGQHGNQLFQNAVLTLLYETNNV